MTEIHVTSEIGKLKKVLLHRPGKELLNLTPDTLEELLFDDIPYLPDAIKEHDEFAKALKESGVEVVYLEDLMAEVIDINPNIRTKFIHQFIKEADIHTKEYQRLVTNYLEEIHNSKDLVLKTMEGIKVKEIEKNLIDITYSPDDFLAKPMPNLYFTRDDFASIGEGISLNRMYRETRNRETIYAEYIFKYHPKYKNIEKYYKRIDKWHIEGGDILNINSHIIAIGISERTQLEAINLIAKNLFKNENCLIDILLAIKIPSSSSFMHLDTVFTQVDKYTFIYHPRILEKLEVYEIKKNIHSSNEELTINKMKGGLNQILEKYMNHPVKLIPCTKEEKNFSKDEQNNDASNTLCIEPGKIIAYDKNVATNELLKKEGIKVIEVHGAELSRGRGGPRCMSMPLIREEVKW